MPGLFFKPFSDKDPGQAQGMSLKFLSILVSMI